MELSTAPADFSQAAQTSRDDFLQANSLPQIKPELPYPGPAIISNGMIIRATHRAAVKAYEMLSEKGYYWGAGLNGEGRALSFHQLVFGHTVMGIEMPDASRDKPAKFARYLIHLHYFDPQTNRSKEENAPLHNHFRPIGVLPIALDGVSEGEAYQMHWERRKAGHVVEQGKMSVRFGEAYGIEDHLDVYHSVHTSVPHISVVIGQYHPAVQYPDRAPAPVRSLDSIETARLGIMFREVLGRYLSHQGEIRAERQNSPS